MLLQVGLMVIPEVMGHMLEVIIVQILMGSNRTITALQKAALTVLILMAGTMTEMESQTIWIRMMTMMEYPITTTASSMGGKSKICAEGIETDALRKWDSLGRHWRRHKCHRAHCNMPLRLL